jgi:hypothetical protein
MAYLVIAVIFFVPLAAVAATGRRDWIILGGVVLAVLEWILAIRSGSDPTAGGEFKGLELVLLTGTFALLGLVIWCFGAFAGGIVRQRLRR